jgi:hypothetical protein
MTDLHKKCVYRSGNKLAISKVIGAFVVTGINEYRPATKDDMTMEGDQLKFLVKVEQSDTKILPKGYTYYAWSDINPDGSFRRRDNLGLG